MPRATRLLRRLAVMLGAGIAGVPAGEAVRVGLLLPFSGPYADCGAQIGHGIELFMEQRGGVVAGRKIEIIRRGTTGNQARRLTMRGLEIDCRVPQYRHTTLTSA